MKSNKRLAVAYLVRHPDEQPEASKNLLAKIGMYDRQAAELNKAINEAAETIEKLQVKFHETVGAIDVLVGIIAESIPDDQAKEMSEKYLSEKEEPNAKG